MNRSIAASLLLVTCLAGCQTRRGGKIGVGLGLGISLLGMVLVSSDSGDEGPPPEVVRAMALPGLLIAIPSLLIALTGTEEAEPPPPPPVVHEPSAHELAQARAWALTKQAAAAARSGDCVTARGLDVPVRQLDDDFHATVFVRDAAIARCLAAPATGSPAPGG